MLITMFCLGCFKEYLIPQEVGELKVVNNALRAIGAELSEDSCPECGSKERICMEPQADSSWHEKEGLI